MDKDSKVLTAIVKTAFKEAYGYHPQKVIDSEGNPPNKKNNYLYNQTFGWYRGIVSLGGGNDMVFTIYKEEDNWAAEFIPKVDG